MNLCGSSLLSRIAMNPECEIQVAMAITPRGDNDHHERNEKTFVELVTGNPYMGEFGQRQSQRRRGDQFERNLMNPPGDARLLREALAEFIGINADEILYTDMHDECGGGIDGQTRRLGRTREYLRRAFRGESHPHLIGHPQLLIPTRPGPKPYFFIEPDFIVWSREKGTFFPGDAKSFVVRDGDVGKSNLEKSRLQLGSQVLALRHEAGRVSASHLIEARGISIFATAFGLRPHRPSIQDLRGPVSMVERAVDMFVTHRDRVLDLACGSPTYMVVDELSDNFREKCIANCLMASVCRQRYSGMARELGDAAVRNLGDGADLERVAQLIMGNLEPENPAEVVLQRNLRRIAETMGLMGNAA